MKHAALKILGGTTLLLSLLLPARGAAALRLPLQLSSFSIDQNLQGQSVRFLVSGDILLLEEGDMAAAQLSVLVDMADLQAKIGAIVQSLGNRNDECGDRLRLHTVTIMPGEPVAEVVIAGHYEKWGCAYLFDKRAVMTRLVQQSASAKIRLNPQIEAGKTIVLQSEVIELSANGLLHALLRDGVLGPPLRKALIDVLRTALGPPLRINLPEALKGYDPSFERVRFVDLGGGKLGLKAEGRLNLSASQIREVLKGLTSGESGGTW
jgi:hypothetical protein